MFFSCPWAPAQSFLVQMSQLFFPSFFFFLPSAPPTLAMANVEATTIPSQQNLC